MLAVLVGVGVAAVDIISEYRAVEGVVGTAGAETASGISAADSLETTATGVPLPAASVMAPVDESTQTADVGPAPDAGGSDENTSSPSVTQPEPPTDPSAPNSESPDTSGSGSPATPGFGNGQAVPAQLPSIPLARIASAEDGFVSHAVLSTGQFGVWMSADTTVTIQPPSSVIFPDAVTLWRWGNGQEYLYDQPIPVTAEGSYTLVFRSMTAELSEPAQSRLILIDKTAPHWATVPVVTFRNPTPHGFTIGFTAAEDALSGVEYYRVLTEGVSDFGANPTILSSKETTSSTNQVDVADLDTADGTLFRATVTAVDRVGNEQTASPVPVMVGIGKPVLTVSIPNAGQAAAIAAGSWITHPDPVRLTASVQTAAPSVALSHETLSGATVTDHIPMPQPAPFEITLAGEGQNDVPVSATDPYGNVSEPYVVTVKVDRTPPTTPQLLRAKQVAGTEQLRVRWDASTDVTSGVRRYFVTVQNESGQVVATRSTRLTVATFTDLPFDRYTVTVSAEDYAGLASTTQTVRALLAPLPDRTVSSPTGSDSADGPSNSDTDSSEVIPEPAPTTPPPSGGSTPTPLEEKLPWLMDPANRWFVGAGAIAIVMLLFYGIAVRRALKEDPTVSDIRQSLG